MITRKLHRGIAGLATIIAGSILLAGCASSSGTTTSSAPSSAKPGSLGDFTFQLPWIKNSQFIGEDLAVDRGYFSAAGLGKVTLVAGPSSGVGEVLSGKANASMIDAVTIGAQIAKTKAPLKIIASTYQKNPYSVLSLASNPLRTPQDLIGKKIGVQDANAALFDAFLAANNIPKDKVTIVPAQYNVSILESKQVDGYISFLTNESITIREDGYDAVDMPLADNGLPFVADAIFTTDDAIKNHRAALEAFLEGEVQGYTDAINDTQAGIDVMMKQTGKTLNLTAANELKYADAANKDLIVTDETAKNGLFTTSAALQKQTLASLAAAGITVTASQLFDMSLLADVYKAHPALVDYSK